MRYKKNYYKSILTEKMDEEILSQMPLWFRRLRETYVKRNKRI